MSRTVSAGQFSAAQDVAGSCTRSHPCCEQGPGLHPTCLPLVLLNSGLCPWSLSSLREPRLEVAMTTALTGVRGTCVNTGRGVTGTQGFVITFGHSEPEGACARH